MTNRPYASEQIEGLERLVKKNNKASIALELIREELVGYRKSNKRNKALVSLIDKFLSEIPLSSLEIRFTDSWLSEDDFERTMRGHEFEKLSQIKFVFPNGCKVMTSAAIKLLTFVNQLATQNKTISLNFEEGFSGTLSYLNRMCFFEHLAPKVDVTPRVNTGARNKHFGNNLKCVEIVPIHSGEDVDINLPKRLAQSIVDNAPDIMDKTISEKMRMKLLTVVETIFSELSDNIREHSSSVLSGHAVCQIYEPEKSKFVAHVAVADSGRGILETLRPKLQENYPDKPQYQTYKDNELVLEMFKTGLSSRDPESGCGLFSCAIQAMKFNASVRVRIKDNLIKLNTYSTGYQVDISYNKNNLAPIQGTTITFEFPLGSLTE